MDRERTSSTTLSVVAVVLLVAHVGLALLLSLVAMWLAALSAHDRIADAMLTGLVVIYVASVAVSTVLATRDQRTGRRSPASWAGFGLLASAAASLVYFLVLAALGTGSGA